MQQPHSILPLVCRTLAVSGMLRLLPTAGLPLPLLDGRWLPGLDAWPSPAAMSHLLPACRTDGRTCCI